MSAEQEELARDIEVVAALFRRLDRISRARVCVYAGELRDSKSVLRKPALEAGGSLPAGWRVIQGQRPA